MARKTMIGVMGPGETASIANRHTAFELGQLIAAAGWILLTGGRASGVMESASQGAQSAGGLTVGILPGPDYRGLSTAIDIAIVTDLGNGRNNVNILSSDVVIACGVGLGTVSEVTLALKAQKPVILLNWPPEGILFLQTLTVQNQRSTLEVAQDPSHAIHQVRRILNLER